jgi:adenylosuccinate lyase
MASLWTDEHKFFLMLKIEILACEALAHQGKIPSAALSRIKKKATFNLKRILKREEKTHHDVVAFLWEVSSYLGEDARYLHIGLTSSDLLDTVLALQCSQALDLIIKGLKELRKGIGAKAMRYKDMVCVGRTHGVHAQPITMGFKFALWYDELERDIERLVRARKEILVGKLSGAVGTYANSSPEVEKYVLGRLGLRPCPIATQVIQRDSHAGVLLAIALAGASLEKFAQEIRHLQRTEVLEVEEPFGKGQTGSSAMPHKKNPVLCERICGLSRLLRTNALAALENCSLWHERDISHSSVERVILPDSTLLLDYMIHRFMYVVEGLKTYPEHMLANLVKTKGLIFSEGLLLGLMEKGMTRKKAYETVQRLAMKTWSSGVNLEDLALEDPVVRGFLSADQIREIFNIDWYLRHINMIFRRLGLK